MKDRDKLSDMTSGLLLPLTIIPLPPSPFHFLSLMLKTVSGEDDQDRADRTVLTPWVKFLWEVYRHVLDILKNNNKVEKLYQDMAQLG